MPTATENDTAATETTTRRRASIAPPSNVQLLCRSRFEYNIARLRTEIRKGSPRQNLDVLVRLCESLVDEAGQGAIVDQYRTELGQARAAVAFCSNTRMPTR